MDKAERDSTELRNVLSGRIFPLKYGFIGVRNQSPDDLKKQRSMDDIRLEEERLLLEIVPDLAPKNGTKYLASKLSHLLARHIYKRLPSLEVMQKLIYIPDTFGGLLRKKSLSLLALFVLLR